MSAKCKQTRRSGRITTTQVRIHEKTKDIFTIWWRRQIPFQDFRKKKIYCTHKYYYYCMPRCMQMVHILLVCSQKKVYIRQKMSLRNLQGFVDDFDARSPENFFVTLISFRHIIHHHTHKKKRNKIGINIDESHRHTVYLSLRYCKHKNNIFHHRHAHNFAHTFNTQRARAFINIYKKNLLDGWHRRRCSLVVIALHTAHEDISKSVDFLK